jgi:hypothetical protein
MIKLDGPNSSPDRTLVEVLIPRPAMCDYVYAWVTLREAWIIHQPGLVPEPGRKAT